MKWPDRFLVSGKEGVELLGGFNCSIKDDLMKAVDLCS
jgi:hypothetical protein